ncbi:MAG: tetratricopeptide repeat protein [Desulfobacterales bacterium]|nr:tetratricopeptide repeat protein [Desulfobacterales bacterium]
MARFNNKYKYFVIFSVLIIVIFLTIVPLLNAATVIDSIYAKDSPSSVHIKLTNKKPYKVVKVDSKEVLVAFKDVLASKVLKKKIEGIPPIFKNIQVESLPDNTISILINTEEKIKNVSSTWGNNNTLSVSFILEGETPKETTQNIPQKPEEKKLQIKEPSKPSEHNVHSDSTESEYQKTFSSVLGGITNEFEQDKCSKQQVIAAVLAYFKKKLWPEAIDLLMKYEEESESECLEIAYFLKAYASLKMIKEGRQEEELINSHDFFHDATIFYPNSKYVPYAIAAIGSINKDLKNYIKAEGYFRILLNKYKNYPAIPYVLSQIGEIYYETKKLYLAIPIFKELISKYPTNEHTPDVKIKLGKVLFDFGEFSESLKLLSEVEKSNPEKLYETSDLLFYLGNSLYQAKKFKESKEAWLKAYNYFPEIGGNPLILIRIADIYAEENQFEKAIKFYKMIMDKFPASNAYALSAIKYAEYNKNEEIKLNIYNKIITEYINHPMAKVAILKIVNLKNNKGEYEESIKICKRLLEVENSPIKRECAYGVQESYLLLFKKLLSENDYAMILNRFIKEEPILIKSFSPEFFFVLGKAYLKGYLYDKSVEFFTKSYNLYPKEKRPSDLIFLLGISLKGLNKNAEAIRTFNEYINLFPESALIPDAYFSIGSILTEENEYEEAIKKFKTAYNLYKTNDKKGEVLIEQAKIYEHLGYQNTLAILLIEAIKFLSEDPKKNSKNIFIAYKMIGESYLKLNEHLKAANALDMAIKFEDKPNMNIHFLLAQSYQRANELDKAINAYKEVAASGDSFWGKLAEEKLKIIELEKKLKNS